MPMGASSLSAHCFSTLPPPELRVTPNCRENSNPRDPKLQRNHIAQRDPKGQRPQSAETSERPQRTETPICRDLREIPNLRDSNLQRPPNPTSQKRNQRQRRDLERRGLVRRDF